MNSSSILSLIELNQKFYLNFAASFHKTRQHPWTGWEQLVAFLHMDMDLAVDVGCGNGRFFSFLEGENYLPKRAIGIDIDNFMLSQVRSRFSKYPGYAFFQADCIRNLPVTLESLIKEKADLITAFGLWHHIPSYELRLENLRHLSSHITDEGIVGVSLWQFAEDPSYSHKLVLPSVAADKVGIQVDDFEPGDYFLGWQQDEQALRYCHSFNDEEIDRLATDLGLPYRVLVGSGNDRTNRYLVIGGGVNR